MRTPKKRRLGRTGLAVTELGFGGISIQSLGAEEAVELISAAADAGINFFDTARVYTDSERKLGMGLAGRDCIVATKSLAVTADALRRELEKSLAELGMDSVGLFQLHNVSRMETLEQVLAPGGALEGARRARDAGLVSHIGVTSHNLDVAAAAIRTGAFATLQIPYNVVEDGADKQGLFALARERDVGVIVMKPLAGGELQGPAALRFALHADVATVIPGMQSMAHLREDILALDGAEPLSGGEMRELLVLAGRLGSRFCRRCQYCLPCPEGIDIPQVFICATTAIARGETERAARMYSLLAKPASGCRACAECEPRCPYGLPIREMLAEAAAALERGGGRDNGEPASDLGAGAAELAAPAGIGGDAWTGLTG
ncbi:MAG: aldo/keto reductase [Candidatus Geothermincolia bacterium]